MIDLDKFILPHGENTDKIQASSLYSVVHPVSLVFVQ